MNITRYNILTIMLCTLTISTSIYGQEHTSHEVQSSHNGISSMFITTCGIITAQSILPHVYHKLRHLYGYYIQKNLYVGKVSIRGEIGNANTYISRVREMCERDDVDAVMLEIESGGGAAGTAQSIFQDILRLKEQYHKPIITWIENTCASGAYYIAAASDYIVATPSAIVGSIGVISPQWHLNAFIEQHNLEYETIQAGDYKSATNSFTPQQPHERDMMQEIVNTSYHQFITDIQHVRDALAEYDPSTWANGKIFTGAQAHQIGLIDATGTRTTAEDWLRNTTGQTGDIIYLIPTEEQETIFDRLQTTLTSVVNNTLHKTQITTLRA